MSEILDQEITLEFFDGKEFILTAVDMSQSFPCQHSQHLGVDGIAFTLDGQTYAAIQDLNDGYRSCLDKILSLDKDAYMSTHIPPTKVRAAYATDRPCKVINFVDVITGETVLEVGTDNSDDYHYPFFVASFYPQNLAANQGK